MCVYTHVYICMYRRQRSLQIFTYTYICIYYKIHEEPQYVYINLNTYIGNSAFCKWRLCDYTYVQFTCTERDTLKYTCIPCLYIF